MRAEPVVVHSPFVRGDRVAWRDLAGELVEDGVLVERNILTVVVYRGGTTVTFRLRDDGQYWADWAPADSTVYGRLLRVARMRGLTHPETEVGG